MEVPRYKTSEWPNLLLAHLEIAPDSGIEMIVGINNGWTDLEDAIQHHAAMNAGCIDSVVSNDRDFAQQKLVPMLPPKQALKRVK